jgi:hypothetical protein
MTTFLIVVCVIVAVAGVAFFIGRKPDEAKQVRDESVTLFQRVVGWFKK